MTAYNRSLWIILVLIGLLMIALSACTRADRDSLNVFSADPQAFIFWVTPF